MKSLLSAGCDGSSKSPWLTMPNRQTPGRRTPRYARITKRFFDSLYARISHESTRAIDFLPDEAHYGALHTTSLVIFVHGGGHGTYSLGSLLRRDPVTNRRPEAVSGDFFNAPYAIAQLSQTRAGASMPGTVEAPANRADRGLFNA